MHSRTVVAVVLAAACDRGGTRETPAPKSAATRSPAVAPAAGTCSLAPIALKLPLTPRRLVAIGDLHGDLAAAKSALRTAGVLDASDNWSGADTVLVQTGDILDRGDDESAIFELFEKLTAQAKAAGGDIIQLDGNHELMNAALDFRYVTPGGMRDFGGDRKQAFTPGGPWAKKLARFNVVAIVNGNVFSHAGVRPEWVSHLDEQNLKARCWLDGQAGGAQDPPLVLTSEDGPVWTRDYGLPESTDCAVVAGVLAKLGAKRMIVGHTPQQQGITNSCDGTLWRIDVGLSAHYGGPIEVLQLGETPQVLRGTR